VPTKFAESRIDLLLPSQSDHQTERLFYRLLLGCVSGNSLGFCHQRIIDLDIGAHRRFRCYVYNASIQYTLSSLQ
jgi:hypothetical protein